MSINYSTIDIRKRQAIIQLLWIGIGSICMFFAGLSSLIFVDKIQFPESPSWFLYSTIVIILSSILLIAVKGQIKKDRPVFILILFVFVLGLVFTYSQFQGWRELNLNPKSLNDVPKYFTGGSKESSLLFVLTGAHLAHLFAGLISLLVITINAKNNKYNSKNYLGIKLASIYWHFLTILWIYLFLFLKYL